MGVGAVRCCRKKFTFAISSPDEFLFPDGTRRYGVPTLCSTVAQIAERFEPNTVLWAFNTIQLSS